MRQSVSLNFQVGVTQLPEHFLSFAKFSEQPISATGGVV